MKTLRMATKKKRDSKTDETTAELRMPIWSVVSFDRCEAAGLTYTEAEAKMSELHNKRVSGLCIVSDEAASRIARRD